VESSKRVSYRGKEMGAILESISYSFPLNLLSLISASRSCCLVSMNLSMIILTSIFFSYNSLLRVLMVLFLSESYLLVFYNS
jgi:hypothetical protein